MRRTWGSCREHIVSLVSLASSFDAAVVVVVAGRHRFIHPLTVVHKIREAADRYVHPMVANQRTLMHLASDDSEDQPHVYGRVPGARIKDRITRWRQMQVRARRTWSLGRGGPALVRCGFPAALVRLLVFARCALQEVVQRFPHLLEQRMFIIKMRNVDQPAGVVSLHVGRQWQCCFCPCSCATKTSAHPDLRHLRAALIQSGFFHQAAVHECVRS